MVSGALHEEGEVSSAGHWSITCRVYGEVCVREPALVRLLQTRAMQRLEHVSQHGPPSGLGWIAPVTRLEHSVGTMWLVRTLGGSIEAQAAALVHDAAHGACSHVLDLVFPRSDGEPSPHDARATSILAATDLPDALEAVSDALDWTDYFDAGRWPHHVSPSPALSADRLDHIMRDATATQITTAAQVATHLRGFVWRDGVLCARSRHTARWVVACIAALNRRFYCHPRNVALHHLSARAITRGLAVGALEADELFVMTDRALLDRLAHTPDLIIQDVLQVLRAEQRAMRRGGPSLFALMMPGHALPQHTRVASVHARFRLIDPHVITARDVRPLSALDADVARRLKAMRRATGRRELWVRDPYGRRVIG